ncbi:J domain-containing protein, partial [bacterium]|nr:J domain-containing protein [bacterium]
MLSEKFIFIGSAVIEITRPGAAAGGRWCDPTPPHMAPRSHYDVLDLRDSAVSTDDIKRAYKAQALRWHPDKPDGNVEEFVLVTKAFETLSDPTVRRQYDAALI